MFPKELSSPDDRNGTGVQPTPPATARPAAKTGQRSSTNDNTAKFESSSTGAEWRGERSTPPLDDKVTPAQATAPPADQQAGAGPGGAGIAGDPRLSTADRLPLKKQTVAVTVDVLAPASMNLKKDATLKLIVRNTGADDAFNVLVNDELPEGLQYKSSVPEMTVSGGGQHLSLPIHTLAAGQDKVITIKVTPIKIGPFDHAATVRFETGCKSRTRVLEPKLKVDIVINPTVGKVLKGQQVEFNVSIQNTGDGVARNVAIQAKLSPGLKHESGPRGEEQMLYELSLAELGPGATEKLDPLVADAMMGGEQFCKVTATSPDVEPNPTESENTKKIEVVEPKLEVEIDGPDQRYTDTVADYNITLKNPGTAPARKVRLLATLPISGRLVKVPSEAHFDKTTSKLYWTIDQIDSGPKSVTFAFQVRMGGIGRYEVLADAIGEGALKVSQRKNTEVIGMPDVDLVVSESKRVVDVGGQTTFQIRLRNYGTKEATNLLVSADLSKNLKFVKAGGGPQDVAVRYSEKENVVKFLKIDKLGPNKEIVLGILVSVTGPDPKLATCRVSVVHDDLGERDKFEDMAGVKVTTSRRAAAAP